MSGGRGWAFLADRTAVLFLGLALGAIIAMSFFNHGGEGGSAEEGSATAPVMPQGAPNVVAAKDQGSQPGIIGARLTAAVAENRKIQIGVFGDSFGDGIWAALYRQLPGSQNFEVHQFSHQSTGFTRYRTTNLLDDTREKIDREPIDVAVISFGANDTQGIYLDGAAAGFMTPRWQQIVTERATAIINLLRQRGVAVYWVGLPRMREADYDRQIQEMNAFYAGLMRQLNVPFIETMSSTVDGNGRYSPYLRNPDTGEQFNARANDGIHMTMTGYGILTNGLAERIRRSVAEARAQAGLPAQQQAPAAPRPAPSTTGSATAPRPSGAAPARPANSAAPRPANVAAPRPSAPAQRPGNNAAPRR